MSGEDAPGFVLSLVERFNLSFTEAPEGAAPAEAERECNLLLAALKEVLDEQEAHKRAHTDEVQRADHWLERVNRTPKERETWLRAMLAAVAPYVPRFGKKSRDLPHGTIGWRKKPERLDVADAAAATAWAKSMGMPTEFTESVRHGVLSAVWKERREADPTFVPPGCSVVEAEETFYVDPKEVG